MICDICGKEAEYGITLYDTMYQIQACTACTEAIAYAASLGGFDITYMPIDQWGDDDTD